MCENLVRIGWAFQELSFEYSVGAETPYWGGCKWPAMPISDLAELFQSKVICVNLVRIGWAFQELSCPQTFFYGADTPYYGGSHLNWDDHFWTRMSYSSQKSCVEIWFGLVEIGGMLILRGAEDPLLGGVTCDLRCLFLNLAEVV